VNAIEVKNMERTTDKAQYGQGSIWLLLLTFAMIQTGDAQTSGQDVTAKANRQVLISIPDRKLAVIEQGKVVRTFPVSVGASASPSPTGEFEIVHRVANPTYYHPGVVIPPGSGNPIGPRWIGLNKKGYGIHGTNQPESIGHAASHGCIRLRNRDIKQLFEMVSAGDVVEIRAERDQQIEEIFGGAAESSATLAEESPLSNPTLQGQ
jgi:lipoprotein-anchoring transpeptidase ErfK/SrfK